MRPPSRLALGLYNTVQAALTPFLLPVAALHPRLAGAPGQRLGRWRFRTAQRRPVWFHGASAGDVNALVPLGRAMAGSGRPLLVSSWTRSGQQMALGRDWGPCAPQVFRVPLDLPFAVRGVLARVQPALVVLECLEMWPNLVIECQRRGVPVAVVNGRLSPRSHRWYRRARWLFGPCFEGLSLVSALTAADAERFISLGVPPRCVEVETSSKHGDVVPGRSGDATAGRRRLVLGSVHPAEARRLLPWVVRLLGEVPDLQVTVAPRYPHRSGALRRWFSAQGIAAGFLSRGETRGRWRVVIHDTVGGLAAAYTGAAVAFVGGSLNGHGGHNVVEPAARGAPVLTGPDTGHCAQEVRLLLAAGAAQRVRGGAEFYGCARQLLERPAEVARRGEQGRAVALRLGAAASRIAARLQALVGAVV